MGYNHYIILNKFYASHNSDLSCFFSFCIIRAGTPIAIQLWGTSTNTTAFAPIIALSPIFISPNTQAPAQTVILSPKHGALGDLTISLLPIVTFWYITQLEPKTAFGDKTTPKALCAKCILRL